MVDALQSDEVSIEEAIASIEARIAAIDPMINALPTLCFERARKFAEYLQRLPASERGALCGLPVTIKDLTPVKGVRTTFGCNVYRDHTPDESDRLVKQVEKEGGIVIAKSNTPEFGTGGITFNDVFGLTRSPRNTRYASGGSSGGAAASLASGCAWLSHGSDMAGSLRTPAAFCGVTSLRPSPGKIRSDSAFLPYDVLGAEGPMARNIEDLGLFADAMMGNPSGTGESLLEAARTPDKPNHVAFSPDLGITTINDEVRDHFHALIDSLSMAGWSLEENHPDLDNVHRCFDTLRAHSYGISLEQTLTDFPGVMKPEVEWNIQSGLGLTSEKLRQAVREQGRIISHAEQFMQDVDILICPATSVHCVDVGLRYPGSDGKVPIPEYYRWLAIAYATTLTALPIITLPYRLAADGMPVGVQLIGKPGGEFRLFQYAREIEQLTGWDWQVIDPIADAS